MTVDINIHTKMKHNHITSMQIIKYKKFKLNLIYYIKLRTQTNHINKSTKSNISYNTNNNILTKIITYTYNTNNINISNYYLKFITTT